MRVSHDYPQAPWIDVPSTIMFRRQIVKKSDIPTILRTACAGIHRSTIQCSGYGSPNNSTVITSVRLLWGHLLTIPLISGNTWRSLLLSLLDMRSTFHP